MALTDASSRVKKNSTCDFERRVSTTQIQTLSEVTEEKRNDASLEGRVVTIETHNLNESPEIRKAKEPPLFPHAVECKRPRLPLKQFQPLEGSAEELRNGLPSEREASTGETPNVEESVLTEKVIDPPPPPVAVERKRRRLFTKQPAEHVVGKG